MFVGRDNIGELVELRVVRVKICVCLGVTTQSNELTSNEITRDRVTAKKFEGSKILKSFKNM